MNRPFLVGATVLAVLATGSACTTSQVGCSVPAEPIAPRLAAPLPGATGVALATRTLIFTGDSLTIRLLSVSNGSSVATTPTALPDPLPSPIATPQFGNASYYAVSVPALAAETTYQAQSTIPAYGCGSPTTYQTKDDGSFTTAAQ